MNYIEEMKENAGVLNEDTSSDISSNNIRGRLIDGFNSSLRSIDNLKKELKYNKDIDMEKLEWEVRFLLKQLASSVSVVFPNIIKTIDREQD